MKNLKTLFLAAAILISARPLLARGEPGSASLGIDFGIRNASIANSTLFGWRYLHKPSAHFALGGAGRVGQSTGSVSGSMAYGGLFGAWTPSITDELSLEVGFLLGAAGGTVSSGVTYGGICVEPNIGLVKALGPNVSVGLDVSYLYIPASTAGSGLGLGLRFAFSIDPPARP